MGDAYDAQHASLHPRHPPSRFCYVARGTFEGFYEVNLKPWDVAAGWLIIEEAGGSVSREDGSAYTIGDHIIVASNKKIHNALIQKLNEKGE